MASGIFSITLNISSRPTAVRTEPSITPKGGTKKPHYSIVAIVVACTLIGCATPRQVTQLVHDIQHDTIYLSNYQFDSVYVFKDKVTDRSRDTLYIREVQTEYKYRVLRNTVLKVQHDSIPYEVTVVQTKEIVRPLTAYDKASRFCFWLVITAVLVIVSKLAFKLKSHFRL